jgi:membrane protein DedA with SNARE-associated domain
MWPGPCSRCTEKPRVAPAAGAGTLPEYRCQFGHLTGLFSRSPGATPDLELGSSLTRIMQDFFTTLTVALASVDALSVYAIGFAVIVICGLGLPVPEDITLLTMGYLTYLPLPDGSPRAHASVALGAIAGFFGCMGGDGIMFCIGRRYGLDIVTHRPFRWFLNPARIEHARRIMDRHGPKILFSARFMPGVRTVGFFTAGSLGTSYFRFLTYDGLAAMISVPFFVFAGWHWGSDIDWAITQVRRAEHGMLVLILLLTAVTVVKTIRAKRRDACYAAEAARNTNSAE